MIQSPRLRDLNPLRLFHTNFSYQQLPTDSRTGSRHGSPYSSQTKLRWPSPSGAGDALRSFSRTSPTRMLMYLLGSVVVLFLLAGGGYKPVPPKKKLSEEELKPFFWQHFNRWDHPDHKYSNVQC